MPKFAVKPIDPGQSVWWVAPPAAGALIGIAVPSLAGMGPHWSVGGVIAGGVVGFLSATSAPYRDFISARARNRSTATISGASGTVAEAARSLWRVHASDRDTSEFIPRDLGIDLRSHLQNRIPALIEGPSMAGKTRLTLHTLNESLPNNPLWFPKDDGSIERLLKDGQAPAENAVVFLDDMDRFLSNQSLTLDLIEQWISTGCTVVATMTSSQYRRFRDQAEAKLPGWDVVNRFTRIRLEPLLSDEELAAVNGSTYAKQISSIRDVGLAPFLGGAPRARERFAEDRESHQWSSALVMAAADRRRIGLGPTSKARLIELAQAYRGEAWGDPDWDEAWKGATYSFNSTVALLNQISDDRWEVLDLISDEADWEITQSTLEQMAQSQHTPREALILAIQLFQHHHLKANDLVEELIKEALESLVDDPRILSFYAIFLEDVRKDHDQAEKYFKKAINADPSNANNLGAYASFVEDVRKDHDQAQHYYQRAINADPNHAHNLGNYAQLLFIDADDIQAVKLAENAISLAANDKDPLLAECHAYLFMHSTEHRRASGKTLKALMAEGITLATGPLTTISSDSAMRMRALLG